MKLFNPATQKEAGKNKTGKPQVAMVFVQTKGVVFNQPAREILKIEDGSRIEFAQDEVTGFNYVRIGPIFGYPARKDTKSEGYRVNTRWLWETLGRGSFLLMEEPEEPAKENGTGWHWMKQNPAGRRGPAKEKAKK